MWITLLFVILLVGIAIWWKLKDYDKQETEILPVNKEEKKKEKGIMNENFLAEYTESLVEDEEIEDK